MKPEKFIRDVGRLLDGCSTESIETWIQWAKECVESEQYLDFKPLPTAVSYTHLTLPTKA